MSDKKESNVLDAMRQAVERSEDDYFRERLWRELENPQTRRRLLAAHLEEMRKVAERSNSIHDYLDRFSATERE